VHHISSKNAFISECLESIRFALSLRKRSACTLTSTFLVPRACTHRSYRHYKHRPLKLDVLKHFSTYKDNCTSKIECMAYSHHLFWYCMRISTSFFHALQAESGCKHRAVTARFFMIGLADG